MFGFSHHFVENDDKNSEVVFCYDERNLACLTCQISLIICCRIFFPHGAYDDKRKSALSDRRKRMAAGTVLVNVTRGDIFSGFYFCDDFKLAVKKLGSEKIWTPENKINSS